MTFLDCHDADAALSTLSAAIGVAPGELRRAVSAFDRSKVNTRDEDSAFAIPRGILAGVGVEIEAVRFDGAAYFHGTRVLDPAGFTRRGILPLDQVVEQIWEMLHELVGDECSINEWAAFRSWVEAGGGGDDGFQYRLKTRDRLQRGPHALLVCDHLLAPATTWHDYLDCPEIVQDIARCYQTRYGTDLEQRFRSAALARIVKFRSARVDGHRAAATAIRYLCSSLCGEEPMSPLGGFDGPGDPVPARDVIEVATSM